MEKNKKLREVGLKEYRMWRQGHLRGHKIIGSWIINRFGLLEEDLDILRKEQHRYHDKAYRERIKLKKEEEKEMNKDK